MIEYQHLRLYMIDRKLMFPKQYPMVFGYPIYHDAFRFRFKLKLEILEY